MFRLKQFLFNIKDLSISFFTKGHERTLQVKKHIFASFLIKVVSIATSLIIVPLTINYVNPTQYGIWLTLSSMVAWISFFDIGFTQGFRNRFTEAKAKGDVLLAKKYVSTTYFFVAIIFFFLWIVLLVVNGFLDWSKIINIDIEISSQTTSLVTIILTYFCSQFVFKIINTMLIADQKPAIAALIDLIGQILSLIIIFLLTKFTIGSLIYLGLALSISPTIILIISNLYLFKNKYKDYSPSIALVRREYAHDIMGLGLKFFVIQIAFIIQYQSTVFLIAHFFDTLQVTSYNIAYKYFGVLQMTFMIIITPFWSSVTDAYTKGDLKWIKKIVNQSIYILFLFIFIGAIMLYFSDEVYDIWIGKNIVDIPFSISLLCYIFFSTGMFASIFVTVINGIGAIKIQFYSSIITAGIFITLSIVFIKVFNFGIESILIASIISNVFGYFIAPLQYYFLIVKVSKVKIWHA